MSAPLPLTQDMVDLQRALTKRHSMSAELKRLAADVDQLHHTGTGCPDLDRKQPRFGLGVVIVCLAGFWLGVFAMVML